MITKFSFLSVKISVFNQNHSAFEHFLLRERSIRLFVFKHFLNKSDKMSVRVFSRKFSTGRQLRAIMDEQFTAEKLKSHSSPEVLQGLSLWKKVTYFVGLPGCLLASIYCINGHLEHEKHSSRPEFVPYEHLRIRTRRFPWGNGDQTLFHNPKLNATTHGYEVDE